MATGNYGSGRAQLSVFQTLLRLSTVSFCLVLSGCADECTKQLRELGLFVVVETADGRMLAPGEYAVEVRVGDHVLTRECAEPSETSPCSGRSGGIDGDGWTAQISGLTDSFVIWCAVDHDGRRWGPDAVQVGVLRNDVPVVDELIVPDYGRDEIPCEMNDGGVTVSVEMPNP